MGSVLAIARRSMWVVLIGALGGAGYSWRRDRNSTAVPAPAEWPPLDAPSATSPVTASTSPTDAAPPLTAATGQWIAPLDDGSCPVGYPIKANDNSGIFHVPDGRFYERTNARLCYVSGDAAIADGYRQSKN